MKKLILVLMLLTSAEYMHSQDSIVIRSKSIRPIIGMSIPELLHIGVRYQMDDLQYGLNIGSFPTDNESIVTYSADVIWHMFGEKNALNDKPWYGKIGYTFMREETDFEINTWSYAHLRFGHEFALSNFIALHIDAGLMFELQHDEIEKKPRNSWLNFDFNFPVLPSIGITTAYSF
ncbi:MAG: hypothetical protein ACK5HH_03640 [Ignavibacteria bacterium]|jgi:hypothetical protein